MKKTETTEPPKEIVQIFDTTLRDGEQSPGISLDVAEKLEIAEYLVRLKVDIIEAGFPVASNGDFEAVHAIAQSVTESIICGLSRTAFQDIDRCFEAIEPAPKKRIHTFLATSETHMKHKLKMSPEKVKQETAAAVARARGYVEEVEFSPEDATRSDLDFMCEVLQIAVDNGATILNIPDTVGYAIPNDYTQLITKIKQKVTGDYILSTHCHDDLGLAVANSLAGVEAGARQVECTVNGIGERAGNAAMEEIVMAIRTRGDYYENLDVNIESGELLRASRKVSQLTGYLVQNNKAVVGRNAFAHESGIHQHGILNERTTYEIMDPEAVGQKESKLVLGKHSGRKAFGNHLANMGRPIQGEALNRAFKAFKDLADKKKEVTDFDIEKIVDEELIELEAYEFELVSFECARNTAVKDPKKWEAPTAAVTIKTSKGETLTGSSGGDGLVHAICQAIKNATDMQGTLTDYTVKSVTGGIDALAEVSMHFTSEADIQTVGLGVSTDVVEASAKALVNALNKSHRRSERGGFSNKGSLRGI